MPIHCSTRLGVIKALSPVWVDNWPSFAPEDHNSQIAANWCDNSLDRQRIPDLTSKNINVLQDILTPPIKPHLGSLTNIIVERLSHRHWQTAALLLSTTRCRWRARPVSRTVVRRVGVWLLRPCFSREPRLTAHSDQAPSVAVLSAVAPQRIGRPQCPLDAAAQLLPTPLWLELSRIFTSEVARSFSRLLRCCVTRMETIQD